DGDPALAERAAAPGFASPEGAPPSYEYPRRDGTVLEVRTIRTLDGGAVRTFTDITEQRRAERAMQEARDAAEAGARARSEFLAVMSHEIRTPLNAIIGLSGLMQDADLPPEQAAHSRLIREAGDHLLALINDILDFSSLESGRFKLEQTPFDPRGEVEAAIELLDPQAQGKGLAMQAEVEEGVPERVVGDPGRLRQVLLNLLNNAVKFTDSGTVSIGVRRIEAEPGQVRLEFAVRDSGIGIPEEAMSRLFSAFQQVDASTNRRFGGTGLGLAISRQLVERMGGAITVESEPGEGSTFRFDILFRAAPEGTAAAAGPAAPKEMPRLRILLAEDNSTNRLVLTHRLQQMGHLTDAVADGREALEAVLVRRYDLIIMDMMMPGMDGLEATRAIRALPGPQSRLPIIGLTAAAMPEDEAACLEAGMDGYEKKPIGNERLRAAIMAAAALREHVGA
ncbi:MAG: response regulator, partial [Acetobacteraceae bacterium]|nr:response regulator [Acetobacteraceae bacterium]